MPALICWFQIIQIFCWTAARYQSPLVSVPVGTPGPGGPNSSPGVRGEAVARAAPDVLASPVRGGAFSAFFPFFASSSGSPFVCRGSSLGGFRTFGGGSAADGGGLATGGVGGPSQAAGAPPPPPVAGPPRPAA